jgi:hypothetical protein
MLSPSSISWLGLLLQRFRASRGAGTYRLWTPKGVRGSGNTPGFAPSLHPDDADAASTAGSLGVVLTNSSSGQGAGGDNLSASTGSADWATSDSSVDSSSSASTSTVRVELVKDNEFYLDKQVGAPAVQRAHWLLRLWAWRDGYDSEVQAGPGPPLTTVCRKQRKAPSGCAHDMWLGGGWECTLAAVGSPL